MKNILWIIVTILLSSAVLAQCPKDMISYWDLEEGTGLITEDYLNLNPGTISGASWTTAFVNNGLSFDGIDDYLDLGNNPSISFNKDNQYTYMLWVNIPETGGAPTIIGDESYYGENGWILYFASGIRKAVFMSEEDYNEIMTDEIPIDTWTHITITYKDGTASIYQNGILTDSMDTTLTDSTGNLAAGFCPYCNTKFNGMIDEIAVFDQVLTEKEILRQYKHGINDRGYCEMIPNICGNNELEYPEQCDDGNGEDNDGCSSDCNSEEISQEFDDLEIIDNEDGTYDYIFTKDGVPLIEVSGNEGLIDLQDFSFSYIDGRRTAMSIGNLTLTNSTKSISLPYKPMICTVDKPEFMAGNILGSWNCWVDPNRVTWSAFDGNKCDQETPIYGLDADKNPTDYTCESVDYYGNAYAKLNGFTHTSGIGMEEVIPDNDNDGINDEEDICPETKAGKKVDYDGCSADQFCGNIIIPAKPERKTIKAKNECKLADWKDNEKRNPGDCTVKTQGKRNKKEYLCIDKKKAN